MILSKGLLMIKRYLMNDRVEDKALETLPDPLEHREGMPEARIEHGDQYLELHRMMKPVVDQMDDIQQMIHPLHRITGCFHRNIHLIAGPQGVIDIAPIKLNIHRGIFCKTP